MEVTLLPTVSGLAFDNWDLDYYTELFKNKLKRNPTSVECFDLAQSNSEHSRHWFFKVIMLCGILFVLSELHSKTFASSITSCE
jgi:phosphoribosylformylglycinamidine (FGAM) synthase-like enzyme